MKEICHYVKERRQITVVPTRNDRYVYLRLVRVPKKFLKFLKIKRNKLVSYRRGIIDRKHVYFRLAGILRKFLTITETSMI